MRRSWLLGKRNHRSRSRLSLISSNFPAPTKRPARKLIINLAMCWRIGFSFRSNRSINSLKFFWRSSQLSPPGSRVAATFSMSLTYSWIDSCSAWTCSNPRSMQPASRPSCFSSNPPFFRVQVPLDRLANLLQSRGHLQAGRLERASLIAIENSTYSRAIVEHHGAGRIGLERRRIRRPRDHRQGCFRIVFREAFGRRGTLLLEHGLFDFPQAAHLASHLNLGVTIGLQHGLGQIAEKMVVAVAMGHVRKLRRDPRHERVLLVRDPKADRLVQGPGPRLGLGDQPPNLIGCRGDQGLGKPHPLLG